MKNKKSCTNLKSINLLKLGNSSLNSKFDFTCVIDPTGQSLAFIVVFGCVIAWVKVKRVPLTLQVLELSVSTLFKHFKNKFIFALVVYFGWFN
jgi:hypothetical protein